MDRVFDVPAEIGPLRWSASWRDREALGDRLFMTIIVALFGGGGLSYGLLRLTHHEPLPGLYFGLSVALVGIAAYIFFGPDRHCMCVGERGVSTARRRWGLMTSREVLFFFEADDVELDSTRIVSDGVSQIYMRTDLTFAFIDREGYEIFAIAGAVDEPEQRATPKYDPTAPLQLDGSRDRGAEFGFAAFEAFAKFKDQRPISPYR